MAYSAGMTIMVKTQAKDRPNIMQTAIAPKNGSVKSGIEPSTVVSATISTGRTLLTQPSRIA